MSTRRRNCRPGPVGELASCSEGRRREVDAGDAPTQPCERERVRPEVALEMDDALAGQLTQSRGVEGHDVRERVGVVDEALEVVALRSRANGDAGLPVLKVRARVPVHQHRIIAPQLAALIPSRAGLVSDVPARSSCRSALRAALEPA